MNTNWSEVLTRHGAIFDGDHIRFANPVPEDAVRVVPLCHLGLIASRGEESSPFLHNLFSNDVAQLPAHSAQWNSFNSPKGRMLASLLLWAEGDGHRLVLSADLAAAVHKKLSMYVLRSKVKLTNASDDSALIGVCGAQGRALLEQAGLNPAEAPMGLAGDEACRVITLDAQRWLIALPAAAGALAGALFERLLTAGAQPAGTDSWQLAMIRAGQPLITAATQDAFVAQMLNYELIGGVSFKKGCYPGQEIVARTQYLGKLKKRMYRVALPAGVEAKAGDDLFAPDFGDQSAGKLVNLAPTADGSFEALAVLQTSSAEAGEVHLQSLQGPQLRLLDLPYPLP